MINRSMLILVALLYAAVWHPPGEGQPADFKCRPWMGSQWLCEGLHLPPAQFANQWPVWELYPEGGARCDVARGPSVTLEPFKGQAHLVVMKPNTQPSSWVRKWIQGQYRQHPEDQP